jgi:hypothetical protein
MKSLGWVKKIDADTGITNVVLNMVKELENG